MEEGNEVENGTVCRPATVQTAMMAGRISVGNPADLATVSRVEVLVPVVCPF